MVANLVARNPRIYLGADQQDWSAAAGDIALQQDSIGQGGIVTTRATIDFFDVGPESISPIANPARWREGAAVQIATANDAGNFVVVANLFILNVPSSPVDGLLSVEAGCWLAWAAKVAKEGDRSGITLGDSTNAAVVAQRLLVAAGIPLANINLGTWEYIQRWPLQKEGNGSYVDQAARLTYACSCRHLYQDPGGVIRAAQWSTTPGTVVAAITAGLNEALFEEAPDPIQPTEIVEVVGQGFEVVTQPQVISESFTVTEAASNFGDEFAGTSSTTTWVFERWGETETTWWEENETLVSQPSIAVFVIGGNLNRTRTSNRARRSYLKSTGRLSQEVATERVDWRQILPGGQFGNSTILGNATRKEVTADYSYDAQEVLTAIVTTTRVPRFSLDTETSSASNNSTERIQEVRWREVQPDDWRQTSTERVAAAIAGGRNDNVKPTALVAMTPQVELGSRPPATERWADKVSSKELHFEARALWVHPGGASGLQRITQITVEPGFSNEQCFTIATLEAQLMEGRRLAYVIEVPLSTALLWVRPLSTFTVDDGSNLWTFRADGLIWTFYTEEARLAFTGICIARVPVAVPVGVALPTFASGLEAGQSAPAEPAAFVQLGDDAEPVPVEISGATVMQRPTLAGVVSGGDSIAGATEMQRATLAGVVVLPNYIAGVTEMQRATLAGVVALPDSIAGATTMQRATLAGNIQQTVTIAGATTMQRPTVAGVVTVTAASTLTNNLLAYYTLNEASGNRADSHSGGYNLTQNGTVGSLAGKVGSAASFPTAAAYLVNTNAALKFSGLQSFELSFWVYLNSGASSTRYVLGRTSASQSSWEVVITNERINFGITTSFSSALAVSPTTLSLNTWHHVSAYYNAAIQTIGVSANAESFTTDSPSFTQGLRNTTADLWVGRVEASTLSLQGRLDEIGIWTRLLTSGERADLYNSGNGIGYPG